MQHDTWLITGGCGFLGRNLIRALLAAGNLGVRVLDNLAVGTREDLSLVASFDEYRLDATPSRPAPGEVQLLAGDILDADLVGRATQGCDVLVHFAANTGVGPSVDNPRMDCETNVMGTFNCLEAARGHGVRRFIFASSGAPVGECAPPIHEEIPPHPVSPYGASKLAGEGYCSAYFRTFGLETVALRFGNVYGPLSAKKHSVAAKFIMDGLAGRSLTVYGDGSQTRDFIHVDDLVRAVMLSATVAGVGGEAFQIATNREHSVLELAAALCGLFGERGLTVPGVVHEAPRLGDVSRNFSDTSKAKRMLGWEPGVELSQGLGQTLDWFLETQAR